MQILFLAEACASRAPQLESVALTAMLRRHEKISLLNSIHFVTTVTKEQGVWFTDADYSFDMQRGPVRVSRERMEPLIP